MVQKAKVKRPRLQDIADATGFSLMTVSVAINPRDSVVKISESTRQKILEKARAMNYKPNMPARLLGGGRSKIIGVLLPNLSDSSTVELVTGINSALLKHGLTGFYAFWKKAEEFDVALESLQENHVCGIITGHDLPSKYPHNVPVVYYGTKHNNFPSIYSGNYEKGEYAAGIMLQKGHTMIGYIGASKHQQRRLGFEAALRKAGLEPQLNWIIEASPSEFGKSGVIRLLEKNPGNLPSALVFSNDQGAFEGMAELYSRGIRICDDISVIGIDNLQRCNDVSPRLSSVDFQLSKIGELLVDMLSGFLQRPQQPRYDIVLPLSYVDRNSIRNLRSYTHLC